MTTCYGVDGVPHKAGRYIPCNTTAVDNGGFTSCCASGDNCLTNGLCQSQGDNTRKANLFWRNGCTDSTWQDPACALHCVGLDKPDTHAAFYCLSGSSWCCPTGPFDSGQAINTSCCTMSNLQFEASSPTIYTSAVLNIVATASTILSSQISTASVTSQGSTNLPTPSNGQASSSPSSSSSSVPSSGSAMTSKTGIYVGVPLGIFLAVALGIIAWLLFRRRKRTQIHELSPDVFARHQAEKQPYLVEADYRHPPAELAHHQAPAELPDTRHKP